MKTWITRIAATAAIVISTLITAVGATPAQAAPYDQTESDLRSTFTKALPEIAKVPFIGSSITNFLAKNLKLHRSKKHGLYLEAKDSRGYALTYFNVKNHLGIPRYAAALSYKGTLQAPKKGAIWKAFPGFQLKNPVIFFRVWGSPATPTIPGSELNDLPGVLGSPNGTAPGRAKLAAGNVTGTLRMPVGTTAIAELGSTGYIKDVVDFLGIPTTGVHMMAAAGVDWFPPGNDPKLDPTMGGYGASQQIGKGHDPNADKARDFKLFLKKGDLKKNLPGITGYVKLTFQGAWNRPMGIFPRGYKAYDPVIMLNYTGDISTWGMFEDHKGDQYVFAADIGAKPSDFGFGFSTKELTLKESLQMQVGFIESLLSPGFLQKFGKLAAGQGGVGKIVQDIFGAQKSVVEKVVDVLNDGIGQLPLDALKVVNPAFVPYDKKKQSYPNVETFNVMFSADQGILADGSRGPKIISNGETYFLGQKIGSRYTRISFESGYVDKTTSNAKINFGKVFGAKLEVGQGSVWDISITTSGIKMRREQEFNLLGIVKKESVYEFSVDNNKQYVRVLWDAADSCAGLPLKVDAKFEIPHSFNDFKKEILGLIGSVKPDASGYIKCGEFVYKLVSGAAQKVGEGVVIGGKYVAKGANIVGDYGKEGIKHAGEYGKKGVKAAEDLGKSIAGLAPRGIASGTINAANDIVDFAKKVDCEVRSWFGGGCSRPAKPPVPVQPRRPAPFYCGNGHFYSFELGRCWSYDASMFAYTGVPTQKPTCLTGARQGNQQATAMQMSECKAELNQQFRTAGKVASYQHRTTDTTRSCLGFTSNDGSFKPGAEVVEGCQNATSKGKPNIRLDTKGRLVAKVGNTELCVRPNHAATHPNAFGKLADWAKTNLAARDITVDQAGRVFMAMPDGKVLETKDGQRTNTIGGGGPTNTVRIDSGITGDVWAVQQDGTIWHHYGKWLKVSGKAHDIGAGGADAKIVAYLDKTRPVSGWGYKLSILDWKTGKFLDAKGAVGTRVDVDGAGNIWEVQENGDAWRFDHDKWQRLPKVPGGGARDISAGNTGTVMVTSKSGAIYVLAGDTWSQFPGAGQDIAVGPDGSPWVTADQQGVSGQVFAHQSAMQLKGWKGLAQPTPFQGTETMVGQKLIYDTCDDNPVSTAWARIQPKDMTDHAKNAGMKLPFQLARGGVPLAFEDNDIKYPSARATGREWRYFGRSEFSAVFLNKTNFALYNHFLGLCLEDRKVQGRQEVWLQKCNFQPRQIWQRLRTRVKPNVTYVMKNVGSGACMTGTHEHAGLHQWVPMSTDGHWCNPAENLPLHRTWQFSKVGGVIHPPGGPVTGPTWMQLQFRHSNRCLDVGGASRNNGADVLQWDCGKVDHHLWRRVAKDGEWFELRAKHSNFCLDMPKNERGGRVHQWNCTGNKNQQWRQIDQGNGWFSIQSRYSNRCLDIDGGHKENGRKLIQWECYGGVSQQMRWIK